MRNYKIHKHTRNDGSIDYYVVRVYLHFIPCYVNALSYIVRSYFSDKRQYGRPKKRDISFVDYSDAVSYIEFLKTAKKDDCALIEELNGDCFRFVGKGSYDSKRLVVVSENKNYKII